jgi:hypothetical protein
MGAVVTGWEAVLGTSTIHIVDEIRPPIVEVTGAVTGRYELLEQAEDGTIVLGPDTSAEAIMRRQTSRPATDEEFEAAFGDLPTGDA